MRLLSTVKVQPARNPTTSASVEGTFRITIKMDSEEAAHRLRIIPRKIGFSRATIARLLQAVEHDNRLQKEWTLVDQQIQATIELLETAYVGERDWLAGPILQLDVEVLRLRDLLRSINKSLQCGQIPSARDHLRAKLQAQDLKAKSMVLPELQSTFIREVVGPERRRGLLAWLADKLMAIAAWFHVSPKTAPVVRHEDTEHTYPGHCRCREYI